MNSPSSSSLRYLLQEGLLFLSLSYVLLLGGTFNGLVLYELNLITGSLLTVGLGAWLLRRRLRRGSFPATKFDLPILALAAVTILTSLWSTDPRRSAIALWQLLVYIVLFYLMVDMLRRGLPSELMVKVMLLTSGFVVFFGLWEIQRWFEAWLSIAGWSNPIPPATLRVRAFLGHPNFVAAFFVLLLPLAMARWLDSTRRVSKILLSLWLLASAVLLFFTSSRGGWLGAAASAGSFLLGLAIIRRGQLSSYWRRIRQRRGLLALMGMAIVVLGVLGALLLSRQVSHPTHGSGLTSRSHIWSVALESFMDRPLVGMGPFTYGTAYIEDRSVPPGMLLAHAHSYLLNTAAEMGLFGLAAVGLLVVALVKLGLHSLTSSTPQSSAEPLGLLAGLCGFSVHSLFDTPITFPALTVIVGGCLAMLCHRERPERQPWLDRAGELLLLGTWVLLVGGVAFRLWGYRAHVDGVLASSEGEWGQAAVRIAAAADRDPHMAFYWLQAGYAQGMAALGAEAPSTSFGLLDQAVASYRLGLEIEPSYGTNWANQGVLLWESGDAVQAIRALEKAVELAPREASFLLTLGRMYEDRARKDAASATYGRALDLRPHWSDSYFFRSTPFRAETARNWREGKVIPPVGATSSLDEGWSLLARGDAAEAAAFFRGQAGLNTPRAYYGLGQAFLEQHQYEQAVRILRIARFLPTRDGWLQAMIDLSLGETFMEMGRCDQALQHFERSFSTIGRTTSLGVGMLGNSDYGWYIYYRASIAADLLPGIEYIRYTDSVVEGMHQAAGCYRALGREAEALEMVERASSLAPDLPASTE
jgi:tetratricopeptide (TPR) repeat protein/O-antigen ligase